MIKTFINITRLMIPHTELEQEAFMEKWNDMVLARTEAAKTVAIDEKVNLNAILNGNVIASARDRKYERLLPIN